MSNVFGRRFRVITWGESHGPAMGLVIDGCPAGFALDTKLLADELAKDVPIPELATTRREGNRFRILSGLYGGRTLGTPIAIVIWNDDVDSSPYREFEGIPRPGHGDLTWWYRYGWTDPRGGGRASGRECVCRIAAGSVARQLLAAVGVRISSRLVELAGTRISSGDDLKRAVAAACDAASGGDTTGGVVEVAATGIPPGLGSPVFGKLNADLAAALVSIGGVKSVEFGAGRRLAAMKGSEANDPIETRDGRPVTATNLCGGLLGGISTGGDIVCTIAIKPTPTHHLPQSSVELASGESRTIRCRGRHDKNFAPRVAPVAEAMMAVVLVDHCMDSGIIPGTTWNDEGGKP